MLTWVQVYSWFSKDLSLPFNLSSLSWPWSKWDELARIQLGPEYSMQRVLFCIPSLLPRINTVCGIELFQEVERGRDDEGCLERRGSFPLSL